MKNNVAVHFFRIYAMMAVCFLSLPVMKAQSFRVIELPNQPQLPVANVHRIMQDREGFMWYGTEGGGLCRDDGYTVEIFRSDRNHRSPLESNNVLCITEDRDSHIWFGTSKGAYILDKKSYTIHRLGEEGIRDTYIPALLAATDGSVWISAADHVFRYSLSAATSAKSGFLDRFHADRFPVSWEGRPCHVSNFHEDGEGKLYAIAGDGGILRFSSTSGRFEAMPWHDAAGSPSFLTAGKDTDELWLATWGRGIFKYTPSATEHASCLTAQPVTVGEDGYNSFHSQFLNLQYDRRHNLLWAVSMDDLYAYRPDKDGLHPFPTEGFLPKGKKILDQAFLDREGNLWVPGYSPHTFIVQPTGTQIRRDSVKAMSDMTGYKVMVDRIAHEHGPYYWIWQGRTNLSLYDAAHQSMVFSHHTAQPAPLSTDKCMEKRRNAPGIWTCNGKKLYKVWNRNMEIHQCEVEAVKADTRIRTLHDNGKGMLYIGTDNAVYRYDYLTEHCQPMVSATGAVVDLTESSDGNIYLISESKGLCRLNRTEKGTFTLHAIRTDKTVTDGFCTLAPAPDGSLWAGTSRGNVCHYLPQSDKLADDEKAGNRNGDAVKKITVDRNGHVWILCDKYLKEYLPYNGTSHLFHSSSPQIGMDYFHTICTEGDSICLGGIGAFCMIAPSEDAAEEKTVPVVTQWITDGIRHLPSPGERVLHITPGTHDVEIFVSTFDFLHSDSIQYAYRIQGDREWTLLPKGQNRISPESIPYGKSELEVKATDREGIWQEPVICLTMEYEMHWAVTASGYVLFIIMITSCAVLYTRKRKKRPVPYMASPAGTTPPEGRHEETPVAAAPSKTEDEFIRKAADIIERNIDNADYSVEQFSNDMCMSRMNMYWKLQALTGQKPSEFIRDIRLGKAVELMQTTELSISEIVDRVGFGTSRYFSKCFKDKFGVSPSQYRTHHTTTDTKSASTGEQM